jgi:hypothetical protein
MKTAYHFFLPCLILALFPNCTRTLYTPQDTSEHHIRFGSGGGFTGATTTYILMDNGQLFRHESLTDSTSTLPSVKRKTYKAIFNDLSQIDTNLLGAQHPGNRYYFLEWVQAGQQTRTIWGAADYEPAQEVKSIYERLMALVKSQD